MEIQKIWKIKEKMIEALQTSCILPCCSDSRKKSIYNINHAVVVLVTLLILFYKAGSEGLQRALG